jgi:hypothetical protein
MHELGHARRKTMEYKQETSLPIGGLARLETAWKPAEELIVALAGPLVNV